MQLSDLYTITQQRTEGLEQTFSVEINARHTIFDGHFPGQPILPGVCTLAIVRRCIALVVGREIRLSEIRECKFTSMVDPRTTTLLEVRLVVCDGSVQGVVRGAEQVVLKIKAKYVTIDE